MQAHLAEYAALTTRNTYWITLQFTLWPTAIIFLALVAQMWQSSTAGGARHFLLWAGMAGLQVIGLVWYLAAREQYGNVVFLEAVLRPRVVAALGASGDVWLYERHLAASRGRGPWVSEWSIAFFSIAGFLGVGGTCVRIGWMPWDWAGLVACLALCCVHVRQSLKLKTIRAQMALNAEGGAGAAEQGVEADEAG
jgi:hypothetical protein